MEDVDPSFIIKVYLHKLFLFCKINLFFNLVIVRCWEVFILILLILSFATAMIMQLII